MRVAFQNNQSREGQRTDIKHIQETTNAKIKRRKAEVDVRFNSGMREKSPDVQELMIYRNKIRSEG